MKKLLSMISILAVILISSTASAAQYATVVTPTSDGTVYVRAVAGAGQPILGVARNGDSLLILKMGNTWHKVRVMRTGLEGYMYGAYISFGTYYTEPQSVYEEDGDYVPDASVADTDTVINKTGTIYSSDGYANLRWGPSTSFTAMARLYNGESVWILEQNGAWYRVRDNSGRIGYASRSLVRMGSTLSSSAGKRVVVRSSDGYATVRTGPSTSYPSLYTLNAGESISVYSAAGDWLRVTSASAWTEAYIYRGLVRFYNSARTTGNVNLRTGPSTAYAKKGVLYTGTGVTLLATDGTFCRVDTGYSIGYASAKYLSY